MVHPDDLKQIAHEVQEHSDRGVDQFQQEYRLITKDGKVRWVDDRTVIERDADERITHYQGIIIDITERKRAEEELYESRLMLRTVLDTIPVRVFWKNNDFRYLGCNLSFALDAGFSDPRTLVGKDDYELGKREQAECYRSDDRQVIESGTPKLNYEELQVRPNGDRAWLRTSKLPLRDAKGDIQGVLGIYEDITERKRAEAEREALIAELETKNAELERFTYTVSHDLKSPLVTVQGFLGFLEQDAVKGDMERLHADIQYIQRATDTMHHLLNDLLELSRIGRVINPPEDVPFADLVQEALEHVAGQITARDVHVAIASEFPTIQGDRRRLIEVVQNLVENAMKFMGEQTEPRIEIGSTSIGHDIVFYVADNGLGIAPQYQEKIFGLFERLDPTVEGTGIGLALVKRIIEVHGGRIWVESDGPGQGSTFYFTVSQKSGGAT
jgi:PAS domain S-box-containing protein